MRNHLWFFASLALIFALALASCSPAPAPTQPPTEAAQPQDTPTSEPAPPATAPVSSNTNLNPYPGPGPTVEYLTTIDPYPAPVQGETIEWGKVAALLSGGGVSDVFQSHTLLVVINMKDDTVYATTEPAKDEIFKLLDQCGEQCNSVKRVSEFFY